MMFHHQIRKNLRVVELRHDERILSAGFRMHIFMRYQSRDRSPPNASELIKSS